jgi:hypothetical protein
VLEHDWQWVHGGGDWPMGWVATNDGVKENNGGAGLGACWEKDWRRKTTRQWSTAGWSGGSG